MNLLAKLLFGLTLGLVIADIADALPVQFVYVSGPHIMPVAETQVLIKEVKSRYRDIGVRLESKFIERKMKTQVSYEDGANIFSNVSDSYPALISGRSLFLYPPVVSGDGSYWLIGFGRLGLGLASIELTNQLGADRYWHSVLGACHELGHILGAHHDPLGSCTIMDTGVLGCPDLEQAKFSIVSKRIIRAYVFGQRARRCNRRRCKGINNPGGGGPLP